MDLKTIHVSVFFRKVPGHEERYSALAYALVSPHRYLSVPPGKPRHRGFTYPGNDVDRCGFSHWPLVNALPHSLF